MKTKKKYYIISIEPNEETTHHYKTYYVGEIPVYDDDEIMILAKDAKEALHIKTIDIARNIANLAKVLPNQMFGLKNIIKIHCITENDEIVE